MDIQFLYNDYLVYSLKQSNPYISSTMLYNIVQYIAVQYSTIQLVKCYDDRKNDSMAQENTPLLWRAAIHKSDNDN